MTLVLILNSKLKNVLRLKEFVFLFGKLHVFCLEKKNNDNIKK